MPLRIVVDVRHINDFGYGTYIRNLLQALGRLDSVNQYFLTGYPADSGAINLLPQNFKWVNYSRGDQEPLHLLAYPLFLRKLKPDLVHLPVNEAPVMMPWPYVVTLHDLGALLYGRQSGARADLRLYLFRRGLLRATRIIAVSQATRRDAELLLHIPENRIRQIYSAPDPKFLHDIPSAETALRDPSARTEERQRVLDRYQIEYPFLLYAGNIRPQKNLTRLIEAFAVLRADLEQHPEFHRLRLIIIGDEILKYPAVRRAVNRSRVQRYVRFLGFVPIDTLRTFYELATAFVFPSLYEGFGMAPLEAMACGTPVITSKVSALPEAAGDAAMLVNPENVFDIAHGIQAVLLDKGRREEMIVRGYHQVRQFSWETTAKQVLDTYREAAATRSTSQ